MKDSERVADSLRLVGMSIRTQHRGSTVAEAFLQRCVDLSPMDRRLSLCLSEFAPSAPQRRRHRVRAI